MQYNLILYVFEETSNNFLDPSGLRVMPSKKYLKKCLALCLLFNGNAD